MQRINNYKFPVAADFYKVTTAEKLILLFL